MLQLYVKERNQVCMQCVDLYVYDVCGITSSRSTYIHLRRCHVNLVENRPWQVELPAGGQWVAVYSKRAKGEVCIYMLHVYIYKSLFVVMYMYVIYTCMLAMR